ncbi:MAG: hypothetical protein AB7G37_09310 [Solirubrobacteraceae bacterium]
MRRRAPFVCVAALALALPGTALAAPGWDLLEPERGNETVATATPIDPGTTLEDRIVVGPSSVRDLDHFAIRARSGTWVTVRLDHHGETRGRALALGLPRGRKGDAVRWRVVRNESASTVRVRVGNDGRLVVRVRCAGTACDLGGAIPYRLVTGTSTAKVRRRAARPAAPSTRKLRGTGVTTTPDESGGLTPGRRPIEESEATGTKPTESAAGEPSGGVRVGG